MKRDGGLARANDLVSVGTAAEMLGISTRYIYVLIQRGTLDWYDIGNRKMLHKRDVIDLLESRLKVS